MDVIRPKKIARFLTCFLAPLAIIIVIAITYREAPNNTFHFDDHRNIVRLIAYLLGLWKLQVRQQYSPGGSILRDTLTLRSRNKKTLDGGVNPIPNRPLPSMTFAIDWWWGRRAVILAIVGYAALVFTYVGLDFLLPQIHGVASE